MTELRILACTSFAPIAAILAGCGPAPMSAKPQPTTASQTTGVQSSAQAKALVTAAPAEVSATAADSADRAERQAPWLTTLPKPKYVLEPVPADADARVQLVTLRRNAVAVREQEVFAALVRLKRALSGISSPTDVSGVDRATAEFLSVVVSQRRAAEEVVAGHTAFRTATVEYRRELTRAPEAYRQAAIYYRERAGTEPSVQFKGNYEKLAEMCDAYGRIVARRLTDLDAFTKDAADTVRYVEQLGGFLKDLEEFFRLSPAADTTDARKQFRDQLSGFAKSYAVTQQQFESLHQKLKDRAFSEAASEVDPQVSQAARQAEAEFATFCRYYDACESERVKLLYERAHKQGRGTTTEAEIAAYFDRVCQVWHIEPRTPTAGVLYCPVPLQPGRVLATVRSRREYRGGVVVKQSLGRSRYEVEAVSGTIDGDQWAVVLEALSVDQTKKAPGPLQQPASPPADAPQTSGGTNPQENWRRPIRSVYRGETR